jgi:chromosome segregation ATPase
MQIVKQILGTGTNTDPVTDLVSLRARHGDAARKVAQGAAELETLTANADKLRLDRARLIDQRDSDLGIDLYDPIRKVEGALASAQKRLDDLQDIQRVRQQTVATLAAEARAAEQAAAPARMRSLSRDHAQDREALRTAMEGIRSLAQRIIASEADMQQVYHAHGTQATGVLVIEGLATTAQAAASDILGKLDWQDLQVQRGDELADKIDADRAEVDRRNGELGYPLYVSPGSDYFRSGWVDESVETRSQRVSG